MRRCTKCGAYKPSSDFPTAPRMHYGSGRGSWCYACKAAGLRQWRAEHREAINAQRRADHRANPEPERARARARYYANRPPLAPVRVARCVVCQTEFRTARPARRYCSDQCRWRQHELTRPARRDTSMRTLPVIHSRRQRSAPPQERHTTHQEWIALAIHELAHGLVGRHLGYAVRTINITPAANSAGCVRYARPAGDRPLLDAIDTAVSALAGQLAEDLLTPSALLAYPEPLPGEDQPPELVAAVIADLPPAEASDAVYRLTDTTQLEDDETRARRWCRIGGQSEEFELYAFCRERSRRLVCEFAAMIVALIPALFARPIMDGFALEAAIEALSKGEQVNA